ncbi:MAG: choice-of-anchor tandem repeat NxxGxxAF-containing protein [Rhodanobacteraceae bacterium]
MRRSIIEMPAARLLLLGVILMASTPMRAQQTHVVVVSGDAAPDGNGVIANLIADSSPGDTGHGPALNNAGQAVTPALLNGTSGGDADDSGLFLYDGTRLVQLAREGQPSPDGDGVLNLFNNAEPIALNAEGRTAFLGFLRHSSSGELLAPAIFSIGPTGEDLSIFLRDGNPSPDGNSMVQFVLQPASLTDADTIAFSARFSSADPLGDSGMVRGNLLTGDAFVVARAGQSAPGGSGQFSLISAIAANDAGSGIFFSTIRGSQVSVNDQGVFLADASGALTTIARYGDANPDGPNLFNAIQGTGASPDASIIGIGAFLADTVDGEITSDGLFEFQDGALNAAVQFDDPAPNGGLFVGFGAPKFQPEIIPIELNAHGQLGFFGFVARGANTFRGIYRCDAPGQCIEIAIDGQPVGDGNGVFQLDSTPSAFTSDDVPHMNANGDIAFFTNLVDADMGITANEGIFYYSDAHGLLKVIRKGDALLGSTVADLRFSGGFNDAGQVAYDFALVDGRSGLAIWSPSTTDVIFRNGFD